VSLNKEKEKVKASGGMWSAAPTTVHLDGQAKGKIKEKTDIGTFSFSLSPWLFIYFVGYKSAREIRREKEREAATEAKKYAAH
jgi:hypothetical protein